MANKDVKPDIFGYKRSPKPESVFTNSSAIMTFDGGAESEPGNLVQNYQIAYNNNVTEIFELGSSNIYWVQGRPTGTASLSRIIGLGKVKLLPKAAWSTCDGGAQVTLTAKHEMCPGKKATPLKITMEGCIVTSIGFTAAVADTRINENISWRFSVLTLPGNNE